MIEIKQFILQTAAFVHGKTVVGDACHAACAEPFYIRDVRDPDRLLDAVFYHLEPDRAGRHGAYVEDSQHVNCLSHGIKTIFIILNGIPAPFIIQNKCSVFKPEKCISMY